MPIYLLDKERKIIFLNRACGEWLGCQPESLIGIQANFHSDPSVSPIEKIAALLCPPPQTLAAENRSADFSITIPEQVAEASTSIDSAADQSPEEQPESTDKKKKSSTKSELLDPKFRFANAVATAIPHSNSKNGTTESISVFVRFPEQQLSDPNSSSLPQRNQNSNESYAESLHDQLRQIRTGNLVDAENWLIGISSSAKRVRSQIELASLSDANVLICGNQGSGRRKIAELIHKNRFNLENPLVPVDCPRMDNVQIQQVITDIFHGFKTQYDARPNILLLDINEAPPETQQELDGLIEMMGVQISWMATSSVSLGELKQSGSYSKDLVELLSTVCIEVEPLSQRRADIGLLAQAFLESCNMDRDLQVAGFTEESLDELIAYHWPGEVGELKSFVVEACDKTESRLIPTTDLPKRIKYAQDAAKYPSAVPEKIDLDNFLSDIENRLIDQALKVTKGNKSKAAELLGITRARLHRRLAVPDFVPLDEDE